MEEPPRFSSERNVSDSRLTHRSALIAFGIFLVLWILEAIYAFSAGDSSKIFPSGHHGSKDFFNISTIFTIVDHVLLSGAYSVLIFILMRYLPNFSYLALMVFWIPMPVALVLVTTQLNIFTIYAALLFSCSCVLTCNLIGTEWLHLPEKILKEACKAIMTSPAAILFSMLYHVFTSMFVIFAIVLHFYLNTLVVDGQYSIFTIILMIMNGIIWLWTFKFIFNIGNLVLTGSYAVWYWGERKRVTSDTVLYCFKLILRYHLGTIALSTSLLGGGKVHRALVKYTIKRFKEKSTNKSFICFFVCNLFDKIVFRIISFFALATCMIKGQNLPESIEETFGLYLKNPRKSLVTVKVIECLLIVTPIIVSLLMLISLHAYVDFSPSDEVEGRLNIIIVAIIAMGSLIFVIPIMAMLYAACNTILLCYLEDSSVNDGTPEKPFAMSDELKKTLDHTDPPALLRNRLLFCTKISSKVNVYRIS